VNPYSNISINASTAVFFFSRKATAGSWFIIVFQKLKTIERVIVTAEGLHTAYKGDSMKNKTIFFLMLVAILIILVAGCTQQQTTQPTVQPTAMPTSSIPVSSTSADTVKVMDSTLGKVLTDTNGMTLYYFITDIPGSGASTCYAAANCSRFWPVFSVNSIVVSPPLDPADFSSITRTDGTKQTTYYGWPLYYFLNDKSPGDVKGENVQKTWYVAKPEYTVMIANQPSAGSFLTDVNGKTLYYFAKDTPGTSSCSGACLTKWPVFKGDQITAPSVLSPADFSTVQRTDGVAQTAYKNRLLYYFSGDTKPGDITGQGFNNLWYVANITGDVPAIPTPIPTTVPTTSAPMSYGGGGY